MKETVIEDYKGFEGATDMYYEKAENMDDVMTICSESIVRLQDTMKKMADGISSISAAMTESADGISAATENISSLVNSISGIKEDAESNNDGCRYWGSQRLCKDRLSVTFVL